MNLRYYTLNGIKKEAFQSGSASLVLGCPGVLLQWRNYYISSIHKLSITRIVFVYYHYFKNHYFVKPKVNDPIP